MEKKDIIEFFDRCAPTWDVSMVKSDLLIGKILDNAEVSEGQHILDVACGTGVMIDYYLQRNVASVTAIDISPEMAKIAAAKYADNPKVTIICGDVEEATFGQKFDCIVVYNAFPHFPYPKRLIRRLAGLLKEEGRLTIAHGMSRSDIDRHHSEEVGLVSQGLMPADHLKRLFDSYFDVEIMISNDRMYQVSGVKRDPLAHAHCGIPHSHGGLTHTHSHGDEEHDHHPNENATPMDELLALMKYLVSHNDAHAQEVADLARELLGNGKTVAYDEIMDAVSDFDMVNAKLAAILDKLKVEEF